MIGLGLFSELPYLARLRATFTPLPPNAHLQGMKTSSLPVSS
jgi:hypothetical protein